MHVQQIDGCYDLLNVHRQNPQDFPFLLESVAKNAGTGRYDILFARPQATLWLDADERLHADDVPLHSDSIFTTFNHWFNAEKTTTDSELPFSGGWFVFLAYEFAGQIEPVLRLPADRQNILPVAYFARVPSAIIVDHIAGKTWLMAEEGFEPRLAILQAGLTAARQMPADDVHAKLSVSLEEDDPAAYLAGVQRIKRYVYDGDVFQVNLSRGWRAMLQHYVDPHILYARLREANPAPFAGLACIHDSAIISSSPERLVKVRRGTVETRPIAGTRPRLRDANANQRLQDELISHPKERAEHVMLIDLERNDLGRVSVPGTVEVNELMVLESYEHVHHIVSNVRGRLRSGCSPMDVIRAVFPGGTITGCPKIRCMEIIAELEQQPRMAYTGSMGYINRNGDMDLNILIRTIIQHGRQLDIRAGAGIVVDSDPKKELEETRHKAKGMLNAL